MFTFITEIIDQFGAFGVGLVMFLENVFPPIPSEVVMPLAGFQAAQGKVSLIAVFISGTIGAVAGAWLWYVLGLKIGRDRIRGFIDDHGAWLTLSPHDMDLAMDWFERHESMAVLFGRMVPGVRTLISVPAGLARMSLGRFLIYSTIGSMLWNAVLLAAGYLLQANYDAVGAYLDPVTNVLLAGLLAIYLYRVVRQFLRRRSASEG